MRTDLPVCTRCCFCLPLRYSLITWGYLRLAISTFFFVIISIGFYKQLERLATENDQMDIADLVITGFLLLLTMTDLALNTVFIIGAHKKNLKLLRTYYIYSIILCSLTTLLSIASAIFTLRLFRIGEIDIAFHVWIVLVDTATLLAHILAQIYVLLLVRSEIIKLRSQCEFRFVNNAAEAECTLKCEEEVKGEAGTEHTYERYEPELYK